MLFSRIRSLRVRACRGERQKKTVRLADGFSGISGVFYALTPLSIRQRSEMPEIIKIKLGGHGEVGWFVKKVEWLYNLRKRG
jgi:hypothetical protein